MRGRAVEELLMFRSTTMQNRNLKAVERVMQAGLALSGLSVAVNQAGLATGFMMITFTIWLLWIGATH